MDCQLIVRGKKHKTLNIRYYCECWKPYRLQMNSRVNKRPKIMMTSKCTLSTSMPWFINMRFDRFCMHINFLNICLVENKEKKVKSLSFTPIICRQILSIDYLMLFLSFFFQHSQHVYYEIISLIYVTSCISGNILGFRYTELQNVSLHCQKCSLEHPGCL